MRNPTESLFTVARLYFLYLEFDLQWAPVDGLYLALAAGVAIVVFILGYWFFKRVEFQFADVV